MSDNFDIYTIGLVHSQFILVTKNYMVYELSKESVDDLLDELHLGVNPEPMSTKWPELWQNQLFKSVSNKSSVNAVTLVDSNSGSFICIIPKWNQEKDVGPCYDIDTKISFNGYCYYGFDDQVLISTNQASIIYATRRADVGLQISKYGYGNKKLQNIPMMRRKSPWFNICKDQEFIFASNSTCKNSFGFTIRKGFNDGKQFYLFGSKHVITFSNELFAQVEKPFMIKKLDYQDFIKCDKAILKSMQVIRPLEQRIHFFQL